MLTGTSLGHYSKVIWRRLWLILTIVLLCAGTTFIINSRTPSVYEASVLIQVHDTQASNNNVFTDQALAPSYALLINSPEVLQAAAQKIPGVSAQQLGSQVSGSPLDNTQIIQIRATANTPILAAIIANTVGQAFIQIQTNMIITPLKNTASTLNQNLAKAKQAVDNDQAQLANLQVGQASQDRIAHQNDIVSNDQISYTTLQASYNQIEQQILQAPNTLTIAQSATVPTTSNSHTFLNSIIAAALSLLVMLIFVLVLDWIDTTIKTPNDVENLAGLRALGSVPFSKKAMEQEEHETNTDAPLIQDTAITQAFVGITTYFSAYGKDKQTFVVTGLHKKAGTSTVAANLAISLAQAGVRVLLIDAHLQRPSLQQLFPSSANGTAQGLTAILTDHNWLQNASANQVHSWLTQWQTQIPNLWFLPSGSTSSQQTTIMLSPVLPMFLTNVLKPVRPSRQEPVASFIDIIIFDAPPLEETADTLALAAYADASLLVIKAAREQAKMLQKAQEMLERLKSPVLGVVVNYQMPKHQSYFYMSRYHTIPFTTEPDDRRKLRASDPSMQAVSNTTISELEPILLTENQTLPAEKQNGQASPTAIPAIPTPNNASLGLGQLLNNSHTTNDGNAYKGKK
jgi:capsular exopolysaccharide synthesis family protein